MSFLDEPYLPESIDGHAVTYLADRIALEWQAHWNPEYEDMWKNINNNGGDWLLYKILVPNVAAGNFVVIQFYGVSFSGKSWLAHSKAMLLKELLECLGFEDVEIIIAHHWSDVLDKVAEAKRGDIIICDEESTRGGQESASDSAALSSILRACREKGIHFFFVDPVPEPKPNVMAWVRVAGKIEDMFTTMSVVHAPSLDPNKREGALVGLDFTMLQVDEAEFWQLIDSYQQKKTANIERLLANRGRTGANILPIQMEHAERLYNYSLDQEKLGLKFNVKNVDTWLIDLKIVMSTKAHGQVVTRVMQMRALDDREHFESTYEDKHLGVKWDKVKFPTEPLPDGFMEDLQPHFELERVKYNLTGKQTIEPEHIQWLYRWLGGETQSTIARSAGIKGGNSPVSKAIHHLRISIMGYAVESLLAEQNPTWLHQGGNSNAPDFITEGAVISIKARIRDYVQVDLETDIALSERKHALDNNLELWCYTYELQDLRLIKHRFDVIEAENYEEPEITTSP